MTAPDFSLLDRPEILSFLFYPRRAASPLPAGAQDLWVPVAAGVQVHARFYPTSHDVPTVLFFHGNGEVVADYDSLAPVYHHFGLNLLAADYRGYGQSGGRPSFTTMLTDAHAVKAVAFDLLEREGYRGGCYLMGRSLGALSATELAATDAEGFRGLILESGAAGIRGWARFAAPGEDPAPWERLRQAQRERLARITLPLLTIHGAEDELIPLETAIEVQEAVSSPIKELVVIPEAGHNDLLAAGLHRYFTALSGFIARCQSRS